MYLIILLLIPALLTGMESDYAKVTLNEATLKEFVEYEQKLLAFSRKTNTYANNNLIKKIEEFAQNTTDADKKMRTSDFQEKLKELFYAIEGHPDYIKSYAKLFGEAKDKASLWNSYHYTYNDLLQKELRKKGVVFPAKLDIKTYLWTNAKIEPETAEYVIAGTILIYSMREAQQRITGKELSPIEIR